MTEEDKKYRLNNYLTDSCEWVILPDGSKCYPWDERFRVDGTHGYVHNKSHIIPEEYPIKEIPHKEIWPTFEDFLRDFYNEDI